MDRLSEVCEAVASHAGRLRKVALLSEYLRTLSDEDLRRAVRLLSGEPPVAIVKNEAMFGKAEPHRLSVGGATLREACARMTGWDSTVLGRCYQDVGDTGETIALLLHKCTRDEAFTLEAAEKIYTRLAHARKTADKIAILEETFRAFRPLALKYFIKWITGNFRIGLQTKMVEEAVALAAAAPLDLVRQANNRLGDLAHVAVAARHGQLHGIEAQLFHPMDFMLAKPLDKLADLSSAADYIVEYKYDGIRSQIHVENGVVRIYTRGMDELTRAFPEVVEAVGRVAGSAVLDGEILAYRDGRPLAFSVLQQRLARKRVSTALRDEVPVLFIAYDLLYRDGALLLDQPIELRRKALEQTGVPLSPWFQSQSQADLESRFAQSRAEGNEGLVLKRRGSVYEPGRRSGAWWKVKRAYATLDVVITAAEQGHGRRATMLSDYTFAVRSGDKFVNVGKAYSGLTDVEIRELTRILRAAVTERFSRVSLVRPEVVLEVAFDGVQKSPRHKSGYALRFPRIVRWRQDKTAAECDDLERVRALYEASLQTGLQTGAAQDALNTVPDPGL